MPWQQEEALAELTFRPVGTHLFELGESPSYDDRRRVVYLCDITGQSVHEVPLAGGGGRSWTFESAVGSLGLAASGRLVIALRDSVILFDPESGARSTLCRIEADRPETRLNDGKVGPDGAFWVGTMDDRPEREPLGSLYRVDPSGKVERKVEGVRVSNGLAFSADGRTMFHSDSAGQWIDRWRLDPATGAIAERTRIATLDAETGRPDGGAVDVEGCYWSAGVSAARLNRFAADGRLLESFPVPVAAPTMPCFAGPDMRTLYVTSLRTGRPPELLQRYPLTGALLVAEAPVAGVPVGRFRDV
jgi:sugar lactone lactonase YvrE